MILGRYQSLFEDRIRTIKGYQANIYSKKDSKLKFMKSRSIPFALTELVINELNRLIHGQILKPIPYSDWASPMVIVPKPDGGIRICGDFKATL